MLTFANERTVPPGGRYFYEVPETRVVISSLTKSDFFARIRKHYAENGKVAPDNLEALAVDFMCRRLPRGFCQGDGPVSQRSMTMSEVKQKTMEVSAGTKRVTPGEANRRAHICANCPMNDRSGCPTCSGLNAWASRLGGVPVPGGSTFLGICKADGVALSAGVALESLPVKAEVPGNCWRRLT
jgi:hypothetical protein